MGMREVCGMAVEMLEGLVQLHAVGIWHLILKPTNVLLDEHQHVYLSDFGMSCALQNLQSCTAASAWDGTPHYL